MSKRDRELLAERRLVHAAAAKKLSGKNYGVMRAFSSPSVQGRAKSACFDGIGLQIGF